MSQEEEAELDSLIKRILDHHASQRELRTGTARRVGDYDLGVMRGDMDGIMRIQAEQARHQEETAKILLEHTKREEEDRRKQHENDAKQTAAIEGLSSSVSSIEKRLTVVDTLNDTLRGFSFMKKVWFFMVTIVGAVYGAWIFLEQYGTKILGWLHIK